MFTSIRIGEFAVTPKSEDASKTLEMLAKLGEASLATIKKLPELFAVSEVDYCKLLEVPTSADDLRAALERIALAVNTGNPLEVAQAYREFDGALDTACNPIREKHGISGRYVYNAITRSWSRREVAKRQAAEVTAGEDKPTIKVLWHTFTKAGSPDVSATDFNSAYSKLHAQVTGQAYILKHTKREVGLAYARKNGYEYAQVEK